MDFNKYGGDLTVDLLLIMWFVIDVVFFILLLLRKKLTYTQKRMLQRSIETTKSLGEKLVDYFMSFLLFVLIGLMVYLIIYLIPNPVVQKIMEWYTMIFVVALLPVFLGWSMEHNTSIKSVWNVLPSVSAILLSIVGYFFDSAKVEEVIQYRVLINILLTIFVMFLGVALFETRKEKNAFYSKNISRKGIRNDLFYRTPRLMLSGSNIELIKACEKHFNEYIYRFRKIAKLHKIEYVNLGEVYRKLWYFKSTRFMKQFVVVSIIIVAVFLKCQNSYKIFVVIGLIIGFGVLIDIYKNVDVEFLYKIGIRYVYGEWGYYLTYEDKDKFVGTVQIIEASKYHKYVHSFLDIAALCRAVAFCDKLNGDKKICIITKNLVELFENYSEYGKEKNWSMVLPVWIAALFEFSVTGSIEEKTKRTLLKSVDESVKSNICIFLHSFWADMERKELKDGIWDYIQLFEDTLYN